MILFPNIGFQRRDGNWRLNVHGWRFQKSNRNKLLGESSSAIAQRLVHFFATSEQIIYYNDTFQRDRLKPFMVQGKKNEEILIIIGNKHNYTTKTDDDGQFRTSFIIPDVDVHELENATRTDRVITYKAVGDNGDLWHGKIHLLKRHGLSIISDIDDTIKVSEVLDKIRLVANTFIHHFRVVEGMPEVYRGWNDKYNCTFHYLSAMPDQLYAVTKDFVDDHQFPDGTFHMRHFHWSSISIYNFVHSIDTKMHKTNHLRYFIFNSLRTLVLIGDSGEHDPEIYGFIARKYPKRIRWIFIRAVKGETKDDKRFLKAFKDIPREKWLVFTDPINELPKDLNIT
ncbi:unnamed protein product [Rotaria socialis]|uniref:Phosphatidate phosphatase APP1 catalytic domain-containing protein n=1 Tax=Rotaria socialis TaxID=392032 RepID=A0A818Q592_9BILA|nr:unnamed protein product [Rotaria socialis]CAF3635765.1 unnamed protein product [Rotaria socialis]CAF3714782.1 unnamed protein product [Rotaria socialis]CAF3741201.1 unnamed protein product [Rotaria socialis]CAF4196768.1 unnamed protein product [Rotaria socialis]